MAGRRRRQRRRGPTSIDDAYIGNDDAYVGNNDAYVGNIDAYVGNDDAYDEYNGYGHDNARHGIGVGRRSPPIRVSPSASTPVPRPTRAARLSNFHDPNGGIWRSALSYFAHRG